MLKKRATEIAESGHWDSGSKWQDYTKFIPKDEHDRLIAYRGDTEAPPARGHFAKVAAKAKSLAAATVAAASYVPGANGEDINQCQATNTNHSGNSEWWMFLLFGILIGMFISAVISYILNKYYKTKETQKVPEPTVEATIKVDKMTLTNITYQLPEALGIDVSALTGQLPPMRGILDDAPDPTSSASTEDATGCAFPAFAWGLKNEFRCIHFDRSCKGLDNATHPVTKRDICKYCRGTAIGKCKKYYGK